MTVTTLIVTAISIASLYDAAFTQHRLRLVETVEGQARLIEAIARFDIKFSDADHPLGWQAATLDQVIDAHRQFEGFGETGEFTLARKDGRQIEFVLSHRHYDLNTPQPIPFSGQWAEPMRRALSGESGTVVGLDYRGTQVLAAYEPVALLDLGLVAKIDLAEIRTPFIRAGLIALSVALLAILISSSIFFRITRPIARKIEQQAETFHTLAETANEGIFLINARGIIEYVNPAAEKLFGYAHGELPGNNVNILMPYPHQEKHDGYISHYVKTGVKKVIGSGRNLTALHKNGESIPIRLSVGDIHIRNVHLFTGVIMDLREQQNLERELLEIPAREQRRIGQELHDGLGQQLTGLSMLAQSLLNKASKPEHELAVQLTEGLQQALSHVRTLSRGLIPVQIDIDGFTAALRSLIQEVEKRSGIPIELHIDDVVHLSDNTTALHLYRVAQEALNNAVKHAGAKKISVSLKTEYQRGVLEVFDNGCGISITPDASPGLGLRIMKHRCGLFDGEVTIDPVKLGGTRLRCRFPINNMKGIG